MPDNLPELFPGGNGADDVIAVIPLPAGIRFRPLQTAGVLMAPPMDEVEIIPPGETSVRFEADAPATGYSQLENVIIANRDVLGLPDSHLAAVFRHEKAHATFSHLPQEAQIRIVNLLVTGYRDQLEEFYRLMRRNTQEEYFDVRKAHANLSWSQKGYKFLRRENFWNGDSLEEVDAVRVVDELIAYSAMRKTRRETLPDETEAPGSLNAYAHRLLAGADRAVFEEIDRYGFFNIEGSPLILELEKDEAYQSAMQARRADEEGI